MITSIKAQLGRGWAAFVGACVLGASAWAATPSAINASISPDPVLSGQSATVQIRVTGDNPTGSVSLSAGATSLGSTTLSAGAASVSVSGLALGSHSITVAYAGDANNLASSTELILIVNSPGPGAMVWQYGYDAMGRPTITVDPNGLTTNTYYDALGRPIQIQQPANVASSSPTITQLAYSAASELTQVTDPRSLATTYSPNGIGQVSAQTSPDSGATSFGYDAKGNVTSRTDARGKQSLYTYDALDRLTTITYPSGSPSVFEYDGGSAPTAAARGELTKITDESGSVTYAYDSLGRLSSKTQVTAGKSFTVLYSWGDSGSALDKLIAITYPSGARVNYSYDAHGDISAISANPPNANGSGTNSASTQNLLSAVGYNADRNITGWSWGNASSQVISYDSFGQISGYHLGHITGTGNAAGVKRSIVRDAAGRITGYTHTSSGVATPALDQSFAYDNLNRLLAVSIGAATGSASSTQYRYDASGNRTAKTVGGITYNNTVSASSNRVTQVQDVDGTKSVQYDAAGNVTSDGNATYTYSDRGRLGSASIAAGTVAYLYNALELRVAKTGPTAAVPTGAAYYVYDEQGKLLGEYDASGTALYETAYLGSTPVGLIKQSGTAAQGNVTAALHYIHADHLGAPRIVTRSSDNAIVWRWDSAEAYGGSAPSQDPSGVGTLTFNQRLPGQVFDQETGLFQNWHREYNARWGRYTQSDPIGLAGGINTYAYVGGNPLSYSDPRGLQAAMPIPGPLGFPIPVRPPIPNYTPWPMDPFEPGGQTYRPGTALPPLAMPPFFEFMRRFSEWICNAVQSPDQQALGELVRELTNRGKKPLSASDADTLLDWAGQLGIRGARDDRNENHWKGGPHIHIPGTGVNHIPANR